VASVLNRSRSLLRRDRGLPLFGLLLTVPSLLFLSVFVYLPALMSLGLGFFHYHLFGAQTTFAGLSNFEDALHYPIFWLALRNTLLLALLLVPTTLFGALTLALLLQQPGKLYSAIRTVVLLPYITPIIATSIGWLWIFNPQYGELNAFLATLHLPTHSWLLSPTWALPSVALYTLWHGLGFDTVIILSALASLPRNLIEAAIVDGAGS
jgi:multiple sugar transport system permease protein